MVYTLMTNPSCDIFLWDIISLNYNYIQKGGGESNKHFVTLNIKFKNIIKRKIHVQK